jgi:hypothetical protein
MGRTFVLAFVVAGVAVVFGACGSSANGVDTCRQIESARCANAPRCNISLADPPHRGGPVTDVASCQRFYSIECLHGLATSIQPNPTQVQQCLTDINTMPCGTPTQPQLYAENPQLYPDGGCSWLNVFTVDAGADADAADGATDAPADADGAATD